MRPLVSIIMPAYNAEKYIGEAILSVQNQTFTNWELLIVEDVSTDNTVEIIKTACAKDIRISFQQLGQNSGTGVARNTALQISRGRYIAFLDADDLWRNDKLETQINFLQSNNFAFCFSYYDIISAEGVVTGTQVTAPESVTFSNMFSCNWIGNLTAMYDSDKVGKLTIDSARKRQDWNLWLTILRKIDKAHAIPESLAYYRRGNPSVSSGKIALLKHNYLVYRKFHQLHIVASIASMFLFLCVHFVIKPSYIRKLPQK